MQTLTDVIHRIGPLADDARQAARARHDQLTKPAGSLGRLEELAAQLAGITGQARPRFPHKAIMVLASDHGVAAEGVSAYPQAVTAQMIGTILTGRAAVSVLARQAGARLILADLGVAADLPAHPGLRRHKIGHGTRNMALEPAMTQAAAMAAIAAGIALVRDERAGGLDLVATGELGIGNTTAASALTAVFAGGPAATVTGRGTGLDERGWARKVAVVERALAAHRPDPNDPITALAQVGGYEIAGLVGVILAAAAARRPIVLDGFITGAAALVATALCPGVRDYLIAAHCSAEPGHRRQLDHLQLRPLLQLDLRLGEGSGAALALPLIDAAAAILDEMATFAEAAVSTATPR